MPTLGEVRSTVFPSASALGSVGPETLARSIAWVRPLKARTPAFDVLEDGDLAIVPEDALLTLVGGPLEPASLAEGIARAGAAGVVLVGEGEMPGAARVAAARLAELGVPSWRAVGEESGQLERAVIGYLVNARAELEHQVARLEGQLEALALGGADASAFVAAVAGFLGRAAVIEDEAGEALAVHAPPRPAAAARDAARYVARRGGVVLREPLAHVGALALLGASPASELEQVALARVAPLLALALGPRGSGPSGRAAREPALPAAGPPWVVLMARQVIPEGDASRAEREEVRLRLRRLASARRLALRGDADSLELRLVLAPAADDPRAVALAEAVAGAAGRLVAVSRPFTLPADRPLAEQEARFTLEAAEALQGSALLVPGRPMRVAQAANLAAYRLLGALHDMAGGRRDAQALLAPLRQGGPRREAERLATLRAVLDHPGIVAAAAALGVHRNTLAYRLARLEALGGWQLDDPDLRFALGVAVRLVQSAQD